MPFCILFSYSDVMLSLTRPGFQYLLSVLSYDPTKHAGKVSFLFFFQLPCFLDFYDGIALFSPTLSHGRRPAYIHGVCVSHDGGVGCVGLMPTNTNTSS